MKTVLYILILGSVQSLDLSPIADIPIEKFKSKDDEMGNILRKLYNYEMKGV